jgi:hypothetical protein
MMASVGNETSLPSAAILQLNVFQQRTCHCDASEWQPFNYLFWDDNSPWTGRPAPNRTRQAGTNCKFICNGYRSGNSAAGKFADPNRGRSLDERP